MGSEESQSWCAVEVADELFHQAGRFEAELLLQEAAEQAVLTDGLPDVPFGQMHAHERSLRALAQWLTRHRFETDLECLFQAAGSGKASAECIERMET